jgi:hypothetical protein
MNWPAVGMTILTLFILWVISVLPVKLMGFILLWCFVCLGVYIIYKMWDLITK